MSRRKRVNCLRINPEELATARDKGISWGWYLLGAGIIGAGLYFLLRPSKQAEAKLPEGPSVRPSETKQVQVPKETSAERKLFAEIEDDLNKVVDNAVILGGKPIFTETTRAFPISLDNAKTLFFKWRPDKTREILQRLKERTKVKHNITEQFDLFLSIEPVQMLGLIGSSFGLSTIPLQ